MIFQRHQGKTGICTISCRLAEFSIAFAWQVAVSNVTRSDQSGVAELPAGGAVLP